MKSLARISPPRGTAVVSMALASHAVLRADAERLTSLRQSPGSFRGEPIAASFLKHADPQTVAGVTAVLAAVQAPLLLDPEFARWGVVAAPRFFARAALAQAFQRFAEEGAWGMSPHLIPNRSLHSLSGTVSQALHIHGPNFGVGGGPWCAAKAMLAATTLLAGSPVPGVFLVLTGWNWEPGVQPAGGERPDRNETAGGEDVEGGHSGRDGNGAVCTAAVLALTPISEGWRGTRLHVEAGLVDEGATALAPFSLESLCSALEGTQPATCSWRLHCGGTVELDKRGPDGASTSREMPW